MQRAAGHLRHHHRRLRAHALRADHRGLLEFDPARAAAVRRAQLRARRQAAAAVRRGAGARRRYLRVCLSERRAAQRLRRVRRDARERPRRSCASSRESGLVNIVGGCCGTTPEHIRAGAARRLRGPRAAQDPADAASKCRLAGLEPLNIDADSLFVNVGERTNVTGSAKFRKLIEAGDYAAALEVARQQVDQRRADDRHQHGRGHARLAGGDGALPAPGRRRAGHRPRAGDDRLAPSGR